MERFALGILTAVTAGAGLVLAGAAESLAPPAAPGVHRGYQVAPHGSKAGDGSPQRPWDLATALSGARGRIRPGDTIWLRAGTYRGPFRSTIAGTATAPVVVRQYPGERAIIDMAAAGSGSALQVRGAWSVFWGFEMTNSNPARSAAQPGSKYRPHAVTNYASHTKYINLIIHDAGVAFYTEPEYVDVEITGCIFYNNGWQGPDRAHGHALYLKSRTGPILVRDNIIFNQFGYGVHAYTNAGTGKLVNIRIEGNVVFNNGVLGNGTSAANILVGGNDYATDDVVRDNLTYYLPGYRAPNVRIGYRSFRNGDVQVENNYLVGGEPVLDVGSWITMTVRGNAFIGEGPLVRLREKVPGAGHAWHGNMHRPDGRSRAWAYAGTSAAFAEWRDVTGLGPGDRVEIGAPRLTKVVVRRNPYETGRATIVVYNWGKEHDVPVDLSSILGNNDRFEIRNVQELHRRPLLAGTFNGQTIRVPLDGVPPPTPVGFARSRAPRTGPDFDVFIVTSP